MGIPTLIKTLTASGDSSLSFVDGSASVVFDSTYDEYMFVCTDIGPATDGAEFQFQVSTDSGSSYGVTTTNTMFLAYHNEAGDSTNLAYESSYDIAQGTGYINMLPSAGNGSDESSAGILHFFSPSNTTYVKHYYSRFSEYHSGNYNQNIFVSGYINSTSAVDAINFKMDSGNFDGVIQMYGIS